MSDPQTEPAIYRPKQFWTSHGIGQTTFYKLVRDGKIRLVKVSAKASGVTREEARRFRESLPMASTAAAA